MSESELGLFEYDAPAFEDDEATAVASKAPPTDFSYLETEALVERRKQQAGRGRGTKKRQHDEIRTARPAGRAFKKWQNDDDDDIIVSVDDDDRQAAKRLAIEEQYRAKYKQVSAAPSKVNVGSDLERRKQRLQRLEQKRQGLHHINEEEEEEEEEEEPCVVETRGGGHGQSGRAGPSEEGADEEEGDAEPVRLKFRVGNDHCIALTVGKRVRFQRIAVSAFEQLRQAGHVPAGRALKHVSFDGDKVGDEETPESLDLEGGEQLDVILM